MTKQSSLEYCLDTYGTSQTIFWERNMKQKFLIFS